MEDKSPPLSWWMQNVQLTSDRCHASSNPNSDSFAVPWHPQLCSVLKCGNLLEFLLQQSQHRNVPASHPHDGSSLHRHDARWVTPVKATVQEPAEWHRLPSVPPAPHRTHLHSFRAVPLGPWTARSLSWWTAHVAVQWEMWTSIPCWAEKEN